MNECSTEGVFLDVIGIKIFRLLLHAIYSHLHQIILPPLPHPLVFLDLRFLQKVGGGLALFTLSLCLPV